MAAGQHDITIEQGATFSMTVTWKTGTPAVPVDITGYTARMQVRRKHTSTATELSLTSGAGITLGGVLGTIDIVATAAQTAAMDAVPCVYDLELVSGAGAVTRLLEGEANVTPEVTR